MRPRRELEGGFERQTDLRALRDRGFSMVKVYWSPENHDEAVLSNAPEIPHLFVLDPDGAMPLWQNTGEDGRRSFEKFAACLTPCPRRPRTRLRVHALTRQPANGKRNRKSYIRPT